MRRKFVRHDPPRTAALVVFPRLMSREANALLFFFTSLFFYLFSLVSSA